MKLLPRVVALLAILCGLAGSSFALSFEDADNQVALCDSVLRNVMAMPDKGIPRDLLHRCRGLAIFPGFVKLGVVVGVSYGNGIVLHRDEKTGKWSKPAFFRIRGGSVGLQAGAQSTDLILLIMSEDGVRGLLEDHFSLGADVSVSAGPIGREASAETDMSFHYGILSYSRSKGIFAGVSLKGASLQPDADANDAYHGKGITVQDVFYEDKGALSDKARALIKTLDGASE
jgi:SH3 domain-containing YSC84-like protein 1